MFMMMSLEGRVVSVLILLGMILAVALLGRAYYRLRTIERAALAGVHSRIRLGARDVERLVPPGDDSEVALALMETSRTGRFDPDRLGFFDWIHWPRYL